MEKKFAGGKVYFQDVSVNGNILISFFNDDDDPELWGYDVDEEEWSLIHTSSGYTYGSYGGANYSPDEKYITFATSDTIYAMAADGSEVWPVHQGICWLYDWLDETRVLYDGEGSGPALWAVNVETLEKDHIVDFKDIGCFLYPELIDSSFVTVSPDGEYLAVSGWERTGVGDPENNQSRWYNVVADTETWEYNLYETYTYGFNGTFSSDSGKVPYRSGVDFDDLSKYELWYYDIETESFKVYFRRYNFSDVFSGYLSSPDPFWTSDSKATLHYFSDKDGNFRVYRVPIEPAYPS
ncbi:MAG: hypothetical protein GY771_01085 [bacterium]|nr:hypothetical protein [bacterium]